MIPILFAPSATSFTTNGIGRLSDSTEGKVIEELNGQYELELSYPKGGKHFKDITYSSIIVAKPFQNGSLQAFRVYKISKPMKGLIKVYARHITYQLNYIPCAVFSGQSCKTVMANISGSAVENCPFSFYTNIDATASSMSANLLLKNTGDNAVESDIINGYVDYANQQVTLGDIPYKYFWVKCKPSTTYIITKKRSSIFVVGSTATKPTASPTACTALSRNNSATRMEYTTSSTAAYIVCCFYSEQNDGETILSSLLTSLTIKEKGTYTWMLSEPKTIRSFLLGSDDSIQAIYGGEFEWDNYTVKLLNNRGSDKGVTIRYGKNLLDLTQEENIENTITGIYPIWKSDEAIVELTEKVLHASNANKFPFVRTEIHDFTNDFDVMPTEEELREMAQLYIQKEGIGVPEVNLTVNFANLSETQEYANVLGLQSVNLGDTVTVIFSDLGVSSTQKVTKTEYDFLNERYTSVTIGNTVHTLVDTIEEQMNELSQKVSQAETKNSIDRATGVMNAGRRGHVIIARNDDGFANEIYFLDDENVALAKNVLRINVNGIGFSSNGMKGPYAQAWTLDGHLTLGGVNNANGTLEILDSNGAVTATFNNEKLELIGGKILSGQFQSRNGEFYVIERGEDDVDVGWSGWIVENSSMRSNAMDWDTNGGVNPSSETSASAAICGGRGSGTEDGLPGTASFKEVWIDMDDLDGRRSTDWAYTEEGRDSSHLWGVGETLCWLLDKVGDLEQDLSDLSDIVQRLIDAEDNTI